jgi:hypothetical protein
MGGAGFVFGLPKFASKNNPANSDFISGNVMEHLASLMVVAALNRCRAVLTLRDRYLTVINLGVESLTCQFSEFSNNQL